MRGAGCSAETLHHARRPSKRAESTAPSGHDRPATGGVKVALGPRPGSLRDVHHRRSSHRNRRRTPAPPAAAGSREPGPSDKPGICARAAKAVPLSSPQFAHASHPARRSRSPGLRRRCRPRGPASFVQRPASRTRALQPASAPPRHKRSAQVASEPMVCQGQRTVDGEKGVPSVR